MKQIEAKITVKLKSGLHARPSTLINRVATSLDLEEITIVSPTGKADAKSVMSLLTLFAVVGTLLKVIAKGNDAQKAIDAIREILETDKYEGIVDE